MTKILDFLVENYIYVAAISGFLIIVLIGFLVKDKRKNKKDSKQVENLEGVQTKEIPVMISPVLEESANKVVSETPILEQTAKLEVDNVDNIIPDIPETNMVLEEQKPINLMDAQPATESFQVIYDNKPETLDFGEHVILDQKALDEEVDIIDFSMLNTFESTNEVASPKE